MGNELWAGGPTQEWIDEQKKKHGDVFKTEVAGKTFVYRALKRGEFKEMQKLIVPQIGSDGQPADPAQGLDAEDKIVEKCVLWPMDFKIEGLPAGSPSMLSAYISEASGFSQPVKPEQL